MNLKMLSTVAAGILTGGSAAASPMVWALNFNQTINTVDAANNGETPFLPSSVQSDGLAADPMGILYVSDTTGMIYSVQGSIPLGNSGFTQIGDLTYGGGGLWGFSNTADTLFFFDLGLATVTYSLPITSGLGAYDITGIARQPSTGNFYLSGNTGSNQDALFLLDLNTASASMIGSIGHSDAFSYVSDIEFEGSGMLLAMTWYHRDFYAVNPADASVTLLSTGPHRDVTGMAILPQSQVPEAGTWVAGLGMALATWMYSRRRTAMD